MVSTRNESSWVSIDNVEGIVPVKELLFRPSDVNFVKAVPIKEGIDLVSLLEDN